MVFPDGWKGVWHAARPPDDEPNLDDVLFLSMLSAHLETIGAAQAWPVFLAGVAHGARFAEHVARHGLLPVTGLFLVSGTTLDISRRAVPVPRLRAAVTCVQGTGDPTFPYQGGPLTRRGLSGALLRRRLARHGELPGEAVVAGAEETCTDWAAGNGIMTRPALAELPPTPGDLTVTRKTWSAPGCRHALQRRRRRPRVARRPAVHASPVHRHDRPPPGHHRNLAEHGRPGDGRDGGPPLPGAWRLAVHVASSPVASIREARPSRISLCTVSDTAR